MKCARAWRTGTSLVVAASAIALTACGKGTETATEPQPGGTSQTGPDLDAEARALFVPQFPHGDAPFDPNTTLFEGKPVAVLLQKLSSGDESERSYAAFNLSHVHHGCIENCMHSPRSGTPAEIRARKLRVVETGRIGDRARVVVPALIAALPDPSAEVRKMCAYSLMDIGPEALAACPALRERLSDSAPSVRLWAARALWCIHFESEAPIRATVDVLLHDSDQEMRQMAAYNLDLMAAAARTALGDLETATHDPNAEVRRQAEQAIASIRTPARR
jgi:HEAT repeat protein